MQAMNADKWSKLVCLEDDFIPLKRKEKKRKEKKKKKKKKKKRKEKKKVWPNPRFYWTQNL